MTGAVYAGFDLEREIRATDEQGLGDTVLVVDGSEVVGLAVCHTGPGSEAVAAPVTSRSVSCCPELVRSVGSPRLLDACEALAVARGVSVMNAGVNLDRHGAYRSMLDRGYRTMLQGVAMEWDNRSGYNREGIYLIDDWR